MPKILVGSLILDLPLPCVYVALCTSKRQFKQHYSNIMTKFVSIIGNGESRRGFDLSPLKLFSTVVGCNAIFRDYTVEYLVCADKHMCQEAVNTVGKGTTIYTRDKWAGQFAMWPNVTKMPHLPYEGHER